MSQIIHYPKVMHKEVCTLTLCGFRIFNVMSLASSKDTAAVTCKRCLKLIVGGK